MNILPIGLQVFDIRWGNGEIKYNAGFYQVYFPECKQRTYDNYNLDGTSKSCDTSTIFLSLTPYTLKDGGFTPISNYTSDKYKKGQWGYFWNDENYYVFAQIDRIYEFDDNTYEYLNMPGDLYLNFSISLPDWVTTKIQEK